MIELPRQLWLSFAYEFSEEALKRVERSMIYLWQCLDRCLTDDDEALLCDNLELDLLQYLSYFNNEDIQLDVSRWLLHECWFSSYAKAAELSPAVSSLFAYAQTNDQFSPRELAEHLIAVVEGFTNLQSETDAATWLMYIDMRVAELVAGIAKWRFVRQWAKPPL